MGRTSDPHKRGKTDVNQGVVEVVVVIGGPWDYGVIFVIIKNTII